MTCPRCQRILAAATQATGRLTNVGAERFRVMPKVEVHLHAAGSVRPSTMRAFVVADGLPPALADRYAPAQTGEGLPAYLARFAAWDATVRSPDAMIFDAPSQR